MNEEKSSNQAEISNNQYYTSTTALQIRLEVETLLRNLELDVRAEHEIYNSETDSYTREKIKGIEPLFKKEVGIRNYMRFIRSILNTQVVQGNLDEDSYGDAMSAAHKALARELMLNRYEYGLEKHNYGAAVKTAMLTIRLFLTRLLDNEERKSYAATFKHVESSETKTGNRGMFGLRS